MIPRLILWIRAKPIPTIPRTPLISTIVTLLTTIASAVVAQANVEPIPPQETPGEGDTFVHLFEWRWLDVAQECETFLAPAGYRAVQVSPPQEHVMGSQWWTRYQPVSYQLDSRGGSAAEFTEMVQRCRAVGVEIYGDVVFNHMAEGSGMGTAGNTYGDRLYPDYTPFDFHAPCDIQPTDYLNDRWRVQHCDLVKLPDLRTESSRVQGRIAAYLQDLLRLGVTGFRLDAAKHVPPEDIHQILGRVEGQPFMLAYPYGYAQVMSSYDFQGDTDAGPPAIPVHGETLNCGITPWQCEHRWPAIVGAVNFRRSTQAYPQVSRWWDNGNRQIAFGRSSLGHLVINGESTEMVKTIATDLPAGTYCNLLADPHIPCDPMTIDAQGQMTVRLAPLRAIAVVNRE